MEADWSETARIDLTGPSPNSPPSLITTFAFDSSQELLWIGNTQGRIISFYGRDLQRYTSCRAHSENPRGAGSNAPVKQLLLCERGVLSVSHRSIHLASRKGVTQWHIRQDDMIDLRCMSFTGQQKDEIVVAGFQRQMFRIDIEKGIVLETLTSQNLVPYTMMRRAGQNICAAAHDGSIHILDARTLQVINTWKAYAGTVSDMDARGDYLLTCGWAPRHYQGPSLEQLVRVYNLKAQRPAPPISFPPGAAFVRMHPKLSSTCMVASQSGAIYSIDVQNPEIPSMRFIHPYEAQFSGIELMPSGKGFAMSDTHNQILLWGSPSKLQFTEFSHPTEFADGAAPPRPLDWNPDVPLNLIGMPYYREALLSGWPNSLVHEVGGPPAKIDPALIAASTSFEYGRVGPWPRRSRRNEIEDGRAWLKSQDVLAAPMFLSEKQKHENGEAEPQRRLSEDAGKTINSLLAIGRAQSDIPVWYNNVEIKYSKFGIDDFDFRYYNKTSYSGLETHIVNSYANPILQLLRFTPTARNLALHHTAQDCPSENCLLCELGFLVDMLEKAEGQNCQATNFLKTVSKQPTAAALAVLEEHTVNTPLTVMAQNLSRFLLNVFEENFRNFAGNLGPIQVAFGTLGRAFNRCSHCHYEQSTDKIWYNHDLAYPKPPKHAHHRSPRQTFSQILKASIERDENQRGWCSRCQSYKALKSRRMIASLPAVLMLNACVFTPEAKQLWAVRDFMPREIGLIVNNGLFFCYEGQDLQFHLQRRTFDITVYELVGAVADVVSGESQKSHLVSMIDVNISTQDASQTSNWHLFNDFLVRKVAAEDALHFDPRWKLPSIIAYQVKSMSHAIDNSWKQHLDTGILYRSVTQPVHSGPEEFRPFTEADPLPGPETHCPIDAEFVRLIREEIDMSADGSRTITRPSRSGLARVSVLRGDHPDEGVPFIDDYIATNEIVDDYLTRFSGLREGDLTEGVSRFILVDLKSVYKKLWVLLNLGCIFVGHGLSSDFRTINMFVPEAQVIDTQELFSLGTRARRKLSLRFLAWTLLKEDIQQNVEEGHDSIEDARTALKLWRKYLEYMDAGILETKLDEIWYKGKATDFKVPAEVNGSGINRRLPETPASSAPGTPRRQPASIARTSTPARSEFGSPLR